MLVFWLSFLGTLIGVVAHLFAIVIFDLAQVLVLLLERGGVDSGRRSVEKLWLYGNKQGLDIDLKRFAGEEGEENRG